MGLRLQIFLSLLIVSLLMLGSLVAYGQLGFLPQIQEIESKMAETDLQRGIEAIYRELYHLERLTRSTVNARLFSNFYQSHDVTYMNFRFGSDFFSQNQLHVLYLLNLKKEVVWHAAYEPGSMNPSEMTDFIKNVEAANPSFLLYQETSGVQSGIFLSDRGPMMLASAPVYDMENQEVKGTLVLGRFFTEDLLDTLMGQTWVKLQIWPFFNKSMPAPQQSIVTELSKNNNFFMVRQGSHRLRAYSTIQDLSGTEPLLISAVVDSPMGDLLERRSTQGVGLLAGVFFLMVALSLWLIQQRVFVPVKKIEKAALEISAQRVWDKKVGEPSLDEVGTLIQSLNEALHALYLKHKQEVKVAKDEGRAEMGVNVMSNIRHGLPSVIEDLQHLEQEVQHFPVVNFDRLVAEISSSPDSSPTLLALMERLLKENQQLHELQKHLQSKLGTVKGKTERVVTATRVSTLQFTTAANKKGIFPPKA